MGEKTGNEVECERIMAMSKDELLQYILDYPDYLTDYYYAVFAVAIQARGKELLG